MNRPTLFSVLRPPRLAFARQRGMTLVEVMISLGVLAITSVGGVSAFMQLNQYASSVRNLSSARALCQERIEQVMTIPFNPPATLPVVTGQQDASTYYNPLGTAANYSSAGILQSSNTATEAVTVYIQQDGLTRSVSGTRTTTVNGASITDSTSVTGGLLNVVQFTVNVAYTYRGKNYAVAMYTLRSPD